MPKAEHSRLADAPGRWGLRGLGSEREVEVAGAAHTHREHDDQHASGDGDDPPERRVRCGYGGRLVRCGGLLPPVGNGRQVAASLQYQGGVA